MVLKGKGISGRGSGKGPGETRVCRVEETERVLAKKLAWRVGLWALTDTHFPQANSFHGTLQAAIRAEALQHWSVVLPRQNTNPEAPFHTSWGGV